MQKRGLTGKWILNNAIVLLFPFAFVEVMLFASDFVLAMRKHIYLDGFYLIYVMFLASYFWFVFYFVFKANEVSWLCLVAGTIELVLFHFSGFWKLISYELYVDIWTLFPYHFFLLEIGCVVYGVMLYIKMITAMKR